MNELVIGKARIPVKIKRNSRLKKSRLSIDQHGVLIEAPPDLPETRLVAFAEGKKEWLFTQWEHLRGKQFLSAWPEQFVSGAKVLFLGRMNLIEVRKGSQNKVSYGPRGFLFEVCESAESEELRTMLVGFFEAFLEGLFAELVNERTFPEANNLKIRFTHRKDRWAYCDENNQLHIGWDLAFLPKKLIEYVLLHELCHLAQRNHGENFWQMLRSVLPDCDSRSHALALFEAEMEF